MTNCVRSRAERGFKLQLLTFDKPINWPKNSRWVCLDLTEFVEEAWQPVWSGFCACEFIVPEPTYAMYSVPAEDMYLMILEFS